VSSSCEGTRLTREPSPAQFHNLLRGLELAKTSLNQLKPTKSRPLIRRLSNSNNPILQSSLTSLPLKVARGYCLLSVWLPRKFTETKRTRGK
jgi:hypothetical protein